MKSLDILTLKSPEYHIYFVTVTKHLRIGKATKGMFINSVSFKFAFCRVSYTNAAPYFFPSLASIVYCIYAI